MPGVGDAVHKAFVLIFISKDQASLKVFPVQVNPQI